MTRNDKPEDVWPKLAAPLDPKEISWRIDSRPVARDGKFFARFVCYVEASTVRERLDSVVPGDWNLELSLLPEAADSEGVPQQAFKARLNILGVVREDVGVGSDYKQAATDAFKRAAVRFGIGHELYQMEQNWVEVDSDSKYAKPVEDPQAAYSRRYRSGQQSSRPTSSPPSPTGGAATESTSAPSSKDFVSCPKCGGRMWDNRKTKRNPKAPDYKCRDRNCDGVIWPKIPQEEIFDTDLLTDDDDGYLDALAEGY